MHSSWFPLRKPNPRARVRLFCLPPSSGSASLFRDWHRHLPDDVEICALQLPGREQRVLEAPFTDLHAAADALASVVTPLADVPYAFFGHSMGATLAYEVLLRLRTSGAANAQHFIASACRAPNVPDTERQHLMGDAELIASLRAGSGFPEEILSNQEFLEILLPVVRADAALTECYTYSDTGPLDVPITALFSAGDELMAVDDVKLWREFTSKSFKAVEVHGDHAFVKDTASLAAAITTALLTPPSASG